MSENTLTAVAEKYRKPLDLGNPILNLHPLAIFVGIVCLIAAPLSANGWVPPIAVSVFFVIIGFLANRGVSYLMTTLKLWFAIGLILFVLRALLIQGETVLLPLGPVAVTAEGIDEGIRFTSAVMVICGGVTLMFALVPMQRLMLAFEGIGVSPRVTYVILASFQSITDLGALARVVLDAQKARGIETEGNIFVRARAFFPILAPVFLTAMSATEERAIALDARAFNSKNKHTSLVLLRSWGSADTLLVGFGLVAIVAGIVIGRLGWF